MSLLTVLTIGLSASLTAGTIAPSPHLHANDPVCLGSGSGLMKNLVAALPHIAASDGRGSRAVRERMFGGMDLRTAEVMEVTDTKVCAKALRIIRDRADPGTILRDSIAVVKFGGRYVARYRNYAPKLDAEFPATYYFNPEFTKVVGLTS